MTGNTIAEHLSAQSAKLRCIGFDPGLCLGLYLMAYMKNMLKAVRLVQNNLS